MGASPKTLARLLDLKRAGVIGAGSHMAELGSQNISPTTGAALASFIAEFRGEASTATSAELDRLARGGTMAGLMQLCGVAYIALDIYDAEGCMLFDLNTDSVPDDLHGRFDLVTNIGTSEHVLDQYRTFSTIHELTKPGGVIYHDLPMGGYFYHGYFAYTPLFFNHLAEANGYEVLFKHFSKVPLTTPPGHRATAELAAGGWPDPGYHDIGIEYLFRKTSEAGFRVPVDTGTSIEVDREFIGAKRSDAVIMRMPRRWRRRLGRAVRMTAARFGVALR